MKAKIRKTGEIVDVISYGGSAVRNEILDYVSYIDSNGVEHSREPLNYYWDFEPSLEEPEKLDSINDYWEKVRVKAAIVAMQGYLTAGRVLLIEDIAKYSVQQADALIKELKKGEI